MKVYINPYKKFTGVFIPDWLLESDSCSMNAKLVYALLCKFAGENGHCFPSQKTLAKRLKVSDRSIRNYLDELIDAKLIDVKRVGLKKTNRYFFLDHDDMHNNVGQENFSDQERKGVSTQDRKGVSTPIERESKKESHSNNSVTTLVDDVPSVSDDSTWESAIALSHYLEASICKWDPTHKFNSNPPSLKSWVKDIDRAIRLDGRTYDQLRFIIDYIFTQNDKIANFWAQNVQSGKKLREQFDKIKNQIKSKREVTDRTWKSELEDAFEQYG